MSTPWPPSRPCKVTIPTRCHPAAKIVFAEMRRQGVTYDELEFRSGVQKTTFKAWRTHNRPGLDTLSAALGALGWDLLPVPRQEVLAAPVREKLLAIAEAHGLDDDGLLARLVHEVAHRPLAVTDNRRGRKVA